MHSTKRCAIAGLFCLLPATSAHAQFIISNILDLGVSGSHTFAYGINDDGTVVGLAKTGTTNRAVIWSGTQMQDLGLAYNGSAGHISNTGYITGQVLNGTSYGAFVWSPVTGPLFGADILGFGTQYTSSAKSVNDNGDVIGRINNSNFIRDHQTGIGLLDLGGLSTSPEDINNAGQIVGYHENLSGQNRAILKNGDNVVELGDLGGGSSAAFAINEQGWIVGNSATTGGVSHAFIWQDGVMQDMGSLYGGLSTAEDINEDGIAVGYMRIPDGPTRAFAWSATDGMIDLNSLLPENSGWELLFAASINNSNEIVGYGINGDEHYRAFRLTLTEVPVPASVWLLGSGLVMLYSTQRSRKRQNKV